MADHFVIDGSNLATEGRTEPSLAQLRDGVAAFRTEHPGAVVTVVVDASFEHRIDPSERAAFSKVAAAGDVVSPPAGAVGRGDGFLLQIANRTGGTVVSNDSFQEFHAEYEWLFEPGRLIGGKPVPGVGWIFSLRRPVRGIVSRKTVQKAKREEKAEKQVRAAIAEATADALEPDTPKKRRRRGARGRGSGRGETNEPEAVNAPAPFLQFVIDHRLGTEVDGVVDAFASHGAFVEVDGVRCYVPLSAMGDPPPSRARDVLTRGETCRFVVQAVDAPRRGIELGLPGFSHVAGAPSDETVAAEVRRTRPRKGAGTKPGGTAARAPAKTTKKKAAVAKTPAKETTARKAAARPGTAKETTARKAAARPGTAKETTARKAAARPGTAKETTARKAAAAPAKGSAGKTSTAKKVAKVVKKSGSATRRTRST